MFKHQSNVVKISAVDRGPLAAGGEGPMVQPAQWLIRPWELQWNFSCSSLEWPLLKRFSRSKVKCVCY